MSVRSPLLPLLLQLLLPLLLLLLLDRLRLQLDLHELLQLQQAGRRLEGAQGGEAPR